MRCGECHGKMFDEWQPSAHARAATSPAFIAMRATAGTNGEACGACHAPLVGLVPAGETVAAEGVTCEVCHNVREVEVTKAGAGFVLRPDTRIKYGPLCDAKDHYFHKMGCSPLHEKGELCGGCHLYYRTLPGGGELPVFTEYEEWKNGPYAKRACQGCHMPGEKAEVATGAGERGSVATHGWLGHDGTLRKRAVTASAVVKARGGDLEIAVTVKNTAAAHAVPTGLPGRRITVRATTMGPDGAVIARAEHGFARILVDDHGTEVPFFLATKIGSDDRVPPKGSRATTLVVAAPPAGGELRLEVVWQAMGEALARSIGVTAVDEVAISRGTLSLGAGRALPATVELKR